MADPSGGIYNYCIGLCYKKVRLIAAEIIMLYRLAKLFQVLKISFQCTCTTPFVLCLVNYSNKAEFQYKQLGQSARPRGILSRSRENAKLDDNIPRLVCPLVAYSSPRRLRVEFCDLIIIT